MKSVMVKHVKKDCRCASEFIPRLERTHDGRIKIPFCRELEGIRPAISEGLKLLVKKHG